MLQVIGTVDGGVATVILNRCMHAGTSPSCVIRSCTACPMQFNLRIKKSNLLFSLRRPQALNSLNANMVRPIHRSVGYWVHLEHADREYHRGARNMKDSGAQVKLLDGYLTSWDSDSQVNCIIIRGAGPRVRAAVPDHLFTDLAQLHEPLIPSDNFTSVCVCCRPSAQAET